jgi:hypothetical protein
VPLINYEDMDNDKFCKELVSQIKESNAQAKVFAGDQEATLLIMIITKGVSVGSAALGREPTA